MSEYPMGTTCGCEHGLSCTTISVCKAESINTDLKLKIDRVEAKIKELEAERNKLRKSNETLEIRNTVLEAELAYERMSPVERTAYIKAKNREGK